MRRHPARRRPHLSSVTRVAPVAAEHAFVAQPRKGSKASRTLAALVVAFVGASAGAAVARDRETVNRLEVDGTVSNSPLRNVSQITARSNAVGAVLKHATSELFPVTSFNSSQRWTTSTGNIAFRAAASNSGNQSTTGNCSKPTGTAQGDVMIAWLVTGHNGVFHTHNTPSGWTLLETGVIGSGQGLDSNARMSVWYKIAGAGEPSNYTFSSSASVIGWQATILTYSGADDVAPVEADGMSTYTTPTTNLTTPGLTRAGSNRMVLVLGGSSHSSITSPSGFTERRSATGGFNGWYQQGSEKLEANSGTNSYTATSGNESGFAAQVVLVEGMAGGIAPVANFSGTPTSGVSPLTVAFTDRSSNSPTSWSWDFGDGGTSTQQSPSHQYTQTGTFTVTLTATNQSGSDSETKTDYITVDTPPPPVEQTYGVECDPLGRGSLAQTPCGIMSDPVNTLTGAFVHAETDLSLASTGVPFELTRTYTSADTTSGRFGQGWTDSYQASLAVQPNGDVVAKGEEGQRIRFVSLGGGVFDGAAGARATLTTVAGGYRLTTTDQLVYEFDAAGKLLTKKDRNGQGVTLAYDAGGRLATVTDAAGNTATFGYNASDLVSAVSLSDGRTVAYGYTSGRLTSFTDVRGKSWTYGYDAGGRLATIVDPLNHAQVSNVYDQTTGRVTAQTDATNKTTTFAWDPGTQTATVTDPNSHVWKDVYANNVLVKRIDATNNTTEFAFDADLNGTSVKSPTNEATTMSYDAAGNLLTATAPASLGSARKTFVYNARNDPTSVTDARNKLTSYTYTPAGNMETVTQDGVRVASYSYDAQGRVLTATDGNGNATSFTYDAAGNVASATQPDPDGPGPLGQPKTTYTYDSQGNVLTRVDPKGNVAGCGCAAQYTTTFAYNAAGQLLTETNPLGHVTTNVYDDAGRLASTTDAKTHTTSYTYDDANRLLTEQGPDPDGAGPLTAPVTSYTYDSAGNKLTETDPRGHTTSYGYDNANRLTSVTGPDPDGAGPLTAPLSTYAYDANGNIASTVEPRGNVSGANADDYRTTYTYDAAGRLKTTSDPLGNTTTNAYDAVGNLQSATDANNQVTSYTHDAAGRILTVTAPDPDGTGPLTAPRTTYTYDPVGNQLTRTDANNHVTSSTYDALNRAVSVTSPDPDGAGSQTPSLTTTAYDLNGNLLAVTDANGNGTATAGDGTTTYGYDRANRLTSIDYSDATPDVTYTLDDVGNRLTMADGSGTETRSYDNLDRLLSVARGTNTFRYVYDSAGNVTRRTYPDDTVVDASYDPLNRLASITSGGRATTYGYDAASNVTTTTLPAQNGYVESRSYDRAGRLTAVKSQKGATVLADISYARDGVGNPLTETRTGTSPITKSFTYDNLDRLTGVCFQAGGCPGAADPFIRWSYDGVGNRLSEQRPTGTTTYAYDNMDRLLSAGATAYSYDRNGNQLTAGSRAFAYDLANRLLSITDGLETTTYSYDGEGKRLSVSAGPLAGQRTSYLWDANHPLPQLALDRDGAGNPIRRYLYGHRRISLASGPLASLSYYHYDPLGSVVDITSASGTPQWTYAYAPFGAARAETREDLLAPENPIRFAGELLDPTGLYHLRARQYDPTLGRFLQVDPAAPDEEQPYLSVYAYAGNRPTVMVDPSGMTFLPVDDAQSVARAATSPGPFDVDCLKTREEAMLARPVTAGCRQKLVCDWRGCRFTLDCDGPLVSVPLRIPRVSLPAGKRPRRKTCLVRCNVRCKLRDREGYTDVQGPTLRVPGRTRTECQENGRLETGRWIEVNRAALEGRGLVRCSAKHCRALSDPR